MIDVFETADVLVSHVRAHYADSVGLIVYYGSYAKGTARPTSDLDLYYVPDEGAVSTPGTAFILDGLPYDFWGPPWRMLEEIANARSRRPWAVSASMIADTRVLYARSAADRSRFEALKTRIQELTQPESRTYMVSRAQEEYRTTLFQLGQMRLADRAGDTPGLHWAGWKFFASAVNCLALVNQTYFSKGWGANTAEILALDRKPANLEALMDAILQPDGASELLVQADRLAREVREILRGAQDETAKSEAPQVVFKDFYYYIHEYKTKLLKACEQGSPTAASSAAFHLQELVCALMNKVDAGFYGEDFNLLGEYASGYRQAGFPDLLGPASSGDFATLRERVLALDEQAKVWFGEHGIPLNTLENLPDLHQFLAEREAAE